MTSVQRNLEYVDLDSEAPLESKMDKKPPTEWPSCGAITFKNVSMTYVDGEKDVLKNLSLDIGEKQKVGIVGRTGAGLEIYI